ncbi:MAG: ThiF family adenylyltransferase [Methanolinea sp.]|nr:ThiF family adenylyltransferase [Methanolinea sp.]
MVVTPGQEPGLWHGIPRDEIDWHPVVNEEKYIGCGFCFLTCGKGVFGFDWERKKSVVIHTEKCVVGCQTYANLSPATAIRFAEEGDNPRARVQRLIKERKVLPMVKKRACHDADLTSGAYKGSISGEKTIKRAKELKTMLSLVEREQYLRQIPIIGEAGQERLRDAAVLVAGAGGLGSVCAQMCACAGFGKIRIVDNDVVERHNLNRQVLYAARDHGLFKVEVAARRLRENNPFLLVEPVREKITRETIGGLARGIDVIIDGMDNYDARYILDDAAFEVGIPLVHGAVNGFYGQVSSIIPGSTPCLHCIVPHPPPSGNIPILGVTVGTIGSIQVAEAIKLVTGLGRPMAGRMLLWDGLMGEAEVIPVTSDPSCTRCNGRSVSP